MSDLELVLCVSREELKKRGVGTDGIYPFDLKKIDQSAFGYLPRHIIDNKSDTSITLGGLFPQILGYFQIGRIDIGKIFCYRRKGKEKGLLGKYSIGVGGHVDLNDGIIIGLGNTSIGASFVIDDNIFDIVKRGALRELYEEIGILDRECVHILDKSNRIISTTEDLTSAVHVGLFETLRLVDVESLGLCGDEFLSPAWYTWEELIEMNSRDDIEFETWSRLIIEDKRTAIASRD